MDYAREGVRHEPAPPIPEWAMKLSAGQTGLMQGLLEVYPRVLDRWFLEAEVIPKADRAHDRCIKIVDVYVLKIRRRLGLEVIETVHGLGFRCGEAFHAKYGDNEGRGLSPWL
jgi:DNA-binding response OmpR family regulator